MHAWERRIRERVSDNPVMMPHSVERRDTGNAARARSNVVDAQDDVQAVSHTFCLRDAERTGA